MSLLPAKANVSRDTWLRRFSRGKELGTGTTYPHLLREIGNAAARETLVTGARHMSAIWTMLFQDMLCAGSELRWQEDGPGFGRDARTAYSSLFGRYLARAYLTRREGVLVMLPLDVAKRRLQGTEYSIEKFPAGSRGFQADWIGFDIYGRLVIAEAKGSYDRGKKTWQGPSRPKLLQTAEGQAKRTVVRANGRRVLPARRCAVVCRWGTAENRREPTILASCDDGSALDPADYVALSRALVDADRRAVLTGLGHRAIAAELPTDFGARERLPGDTSLSVRGIKFPPGAAALAGPFGFLPLHGQDDVASIGDLRLDPSNPSVAVASLSSRHATTFPRPVPFERGYNSLAADRDDNTYELAGLSVAWLREPTDIEFDNG